MDTLKEVDSSTILQKVMSVVASAKQEILATMDITEEIENPLPLEYFFLLKKKIKSGVKVTRLAFGTIAEFKIFNERYETKDKYYKCILAATKNYKRMLLVDGKHLFFAADVKDRRKFFYTTNSRYIKKFSRYFYRELKLAE